MQRQHVIKAFGVLRASSCTTPLLHLVHSPPALIYIHLSQTLTHGSKTCWGQEVEKGELLRMPISRQWSILLFQIISCSSPPLFIQPISGEHPLVPGPVVALGKQNIIWEASLNIWELLSSHVNPKYKVTPSAFWSEIWKETVAWLWPLTILFVLRGSIAAPSTDPRELKARASRGRWSWVRAGTQHSTRTLKLSFIF